MNDWDQIRRLDEALDAALDYIGELERQLAQWDRRFRPTESGIIRQDASGLPLHKTEAAPIDRSRTTL